MIVTNFENVNRFYGLSKALKICVDYAKNNDLVNFENGSYEICNGIKVNINDFSCTNEPKYEGHRKMVDIQLDLTGQEKCFVSDIKYGKIEVPYNDEKDVQWFSVEPKREFSEILMDINTLVILFPEDIHSPTMYYGFEKVKKAIFKIDVNYFKKK